MGSMGASCTCKLLTKRCTQREVDVIEVSSTTLMLRGYLVRAEEVRTRSRVDGKEIYILPDARPALLAAPCSQAQADSVCRIATETRPTHNSGPSCAGLGHIKHPLEETWVI